MIRTRMRDAGFEARGGRHVKIPFSAPSTPASRSVGGFVLQPSAAPCPANRGLTTEELLRLRRHAETRAAQALQREAVEI